MPTPILKIDQAGIPVGVPGRGRTDGVATGGLVTLTSTGPGAVHTIRLLWVPSGDTSAVGSLTAPPAAVATFSPTPGVYGTYRIELDVDGQKTRRTFTIRTPNLALVIPAFNEKADPQASLLNNGVVQVERSENNEPYGPGIDYAGWWAAMEDAFLKLDGITVGAISEVITGPFVSGPISPTFNDLVLFDTTGGAIVANLPSAITGAGKKIRFKRTTANVNNFSLVTTLGQTIDGFAGPLIFGGPGAEFEIIEITSDGADWVLTS
jgi:hypothetical protein